ncbi:MAG: sugar ABC transporter permease [Mesoaciditoga sp.]|uniref:carbohydrate ABC transporter permease n=2 Tax=Athalassotoga sp. TaxID=2022597 RepID=UPI000CAD6D12|nr:MAG: sugar ABC transporter permease [Mesoaciditoga sp.]HEU23782.1 carbohydrate ABC transporter permease [Mesoaciditoga lauensis]
MKKLKIFLRSLLKFMALGGYLIFALIPLYWVLITSFKGPKELYTFPITFWPKSLDIENYKFLFSFANFGIYFRNSLLVSLGASFGALIVSVLSGYGLSRIGFKKLSNGLLLAMYLTQMIPGFLLMLPLFLMLSKFGMINNLFVLGIIYIDMVIAFGTIMSKGFFDRIPVSLEEAALIDGCGTLEVLYRIVLPVSLPAIMAIFSFFFVNIWNELFLAVMFLSSNDKMTIPAALNSFISKAGISWGVMSAGLVVALLPTIIVFAFAQKYIIAGLTEGAVKE